MINYFIRHPTLANMVMLGFILLGLIALPSIKRETFPEFSLDTVIATVVYPGASPSEVEESICLRMEDAVDGLGDIDETICDAQESVATLNIKLIEGSDVSRALVDVQTQINAIKDFPTQIEPPIVQELGWAEPVVDIAIAANSSLPHLKAYAENLKQRLKIDAGVALVDVTGFSDHQLRIELNPFELRRMGLTASQVADQVRKQNIKLPAGTIELSDKNLLIRFDDQRITPNDLSNLVIAADSLGGVIRLKDVAKITDRFEIDEERIFFDGKPSAILKVKKNKRDDALRIMERVQAFIDMEKQRVPNGITLTLTNDISSIVQDRLQMMTKNGWQGILLVFFAMWLFFSLRYSFWVSAGLPVAFMGGFFLMGYFGVSINLMSLIGLLMAIGIMMDDAIVIAESIAAHIDRGLPPAEATVQGVKKVAPGVFSSYLTTVCIFGSLLTLDGQMGAVLSVVPLVLIIVLSVSLIEAFLILPNHLCHSLQNARQDKPPHKYKQAFIDRFEQFKEGVLVRGVTAAVKWRYASLGIVLGLFLVSIALLSGGIVKFVPFPELDGDIAEARIIMPPGTTLKQTEALVEEIVAKAQVISNELTKENNEQESLIHHITEQYNYNMDAGESGPHVATIRLDLLSGETRKTLINDFLNAWRTTVGEKADPLSLVFTQPSMGPAGRDIEIRIQGGELNQLKSASVELQQYLREFDGVNGILDDMRLGKEELIVKLRPGAESFGVNGMIIADQLRTAYFGTITDEIQVGPENIEVEVRIEKSKISHIPELENFAITLTNGSHIPLSSIAEITPDRSFVRIQRIDGLRSVTVMAEVDNQRANASEVVNSVSQKFLPELQQRYPDLRFNFDGASKETAKTSASMIKGFLVGIFGVFFILSFQFKSYLQPVIVMSAIPMALIGVIWGHFLLGHSLSMPSILGFISLAGIVVNDSILLVQYIRLNVQDGIPVHEAVIAASRERFRAVFITSLTTAMGLLPLLLETSLQAQVVKPIVISIVFGVFSSTLLVLFIIPCAYAVYADYREFKLHH